MQIINPSVLHFDESGNKIGRVIVRNYQASISGGAGQTSTFLTSNGLTKGAGNTFTFNNVRNVTAMANTVQTLAEGSMFTGWSYNATTGELITRFLESAVVVLLAEALEVEENGVIIKITVFGD